MPLSGRLVGPLAWAAWWARPFLVCLCVSATVSRGSAAEPVHVWWEGEKPVATNFAERTGFDARTFQKIRHEVLSEGDWLTNGGKRRPGEREAFARYEIDVPADGTYGFWTRKFWKHGPFRWRFDRPGLRSRGGRFGGVGEEWRTCGRDISLADSTYIRLHLGANWVYLGEVRLTRGPHDFELRLLAGEGQGKTACFDAFLLIQGPFAPRGRLKPGEKSGKAEPGFFAWEPDADPLTDACPIDLRRLNERVAGEKGFVRRRGYDFALADGKPVRFWMVQGTSLLPMSHVEIDWWARRLAKYGVNMVRLEAKVWDSKQKDPRAIDRTALDRIHYAVSAFKKQGIYVYLGHVFWANWSIREDQGFAGYGNGKPCHGLLEFSPEMKSVYCSWARALMRTPNPYTGIALADDPAVAVYEIQNEDSVLFWAFNPDRLPEPTRKMVEERFYEWAVRKHRDVAGAYAAWGGQKHKRDAPGQRRLGLLHPWNLTTDGLQKQPHLKRRASDQFRFLVETQKASYDEIVKYLRGKLGLKCCIACSNWKTADARLMDTMERYTYTAGDVMCRNEYYGVRYDPKPKRFYAVDVGDTYAERSGLLVPERAPLQLNQMAAYPHMITENNWNRPSRFRAEFPFLVATYASLSGVDGWNFFALSSDVWDSSMKIWAVNTTTVLGQFPAAALMFRRRDVREAETVVHEALTFAEQYDFKGTAIREAQGLDELWQRKVGADKVIDKVIRGQSPSALDPLTFYVGRVVRSLGTDKRDALIKDVRGYIDRERKTVRSITGELFWDYGKGYVTVNTPRSQGACGFLRAAGRIELKDVVIESDNDYISVLVVSLDDRPLAASRKILIQAGTEDHTYGFKTQALGEKRRITALGGYPLTVRRIRATVTLRRAGGRAEAVVLDGNGYLTRRRAGIGRVRGLRISLPEDALYTLVR